MKNSSTRNRRCLKGSVTPSTSYLCIRSGEVVVFPHLHNKLKTLAVEAVKRTSAAVKTVLKKKKKKPHVEGEIKSDGDTFECMALRACLTLLCSKWRLDKLNKMVKVVCCQIVWRTIKTMLFIVIRQAIQVLVSLPVICNCNNGLQKADVQRTHVITGKKQTL